MITVDRSPKQIKDLLIIIGCLWVLSATSLFFMIKLINSDPWWFFISNTATCVLAFFACFFTTSLIIDIFRKEKNDGRLY